MADRDAEKQGAARHAAGLVQDGMAVGLGSGSTAAHAVRFLGERVRAEGLRIVGVPTSPATAALAAAAGIPLLADRDRFQLDIAIDGADRVAANGDLIKGAGGALLHERIVAAAATRFVVVTDASKLAEGLDGCPLPVEVFPFGWANAVPRLAALGCHPVRRERDGRLFMTEEGNVIFDCAVDPAALADPAALDRALRAIPGVADHGLFLGMAHVVVVGRGDRVEVIELR